MYIERGQGTKVCVFLSRDILLHKHPFFLGARRPENPALFSPWIVKGEGGEEINVLGLSD